MKLQAADDPWKHQVPHVSLSPAEGDIGKDLGAYGEEREQMCLHGPFLRSAAVLHTGDCGTVFNLRCFYAVCIYSTSCLENKCVCVVFRAQRGTLHDISALDTC